LLVAGCGGDGESKFVGTWSGATPGLGLTIAITDEVPEGDTLRLQGHINSAKKLCLVDGPMAGTAMNDTVKLSSHGTGTRSRLTLVDISGQLTGDKIMATLTMKGDTSNEEQCAFDQTPIVFQKMAASR
jgi:hypothetical protein